MLKSRRQWLQQAKMIGVKSKRRKWPLKIKKMPRFTKWLHSALNKTINKETRQIIITNKVTIKIKQRAIQVSRLRPMLEAPTPFKAVPSQALTLSCQCLRASSLNPKQHPPCLCPFQNSSNNNQQINRPLHCLRFLHQLLKRIRASCHLRRSCSGCKPMGRSNWKKKRKNSERMKGNFLKPNSFNSNSSNRITISSSVDNLCSCLQTTVITTICGNSSSITGMRAMAKRMIMVMKMATTQCSSSRSTLWPL